MKKTTSLFLLLSSLGFAASGWASVTCSFLPNGPAINTTVALQGGNITVGQDIPNGTVLFRQYFKVGTRPYIHCDSTGVPWRYQQTFRYLANPKPLSAWNSGSWAGKVYETGVPGIGIAAWYAGTAVPLIRNNDTVTTSGYHYFTFPEFDISLIKTGPVSPGTVLGQDLPTVISEFIAEGGNTLRISTVRFNGALNVVSQTCTTPNPVVQLGTYNAAVSFKGEGSVTGWANASLNLTHCPRFYGTMDSGQANYGSESPADPGQAGTPNNNTLGLTLKPNTSVIDAGKGIVALKSEPNAATGVGIQLATAANGSVYTAAVFNREMNYTMTNNASGAVTLPLFARFYQTGNTVTPGPANATMTYTINYY